VNVNWKIAENQEPILFSRKAKWTGVNIYHWRVLPGELIERAINFHEISIPLAGSLTTNKQTASGNLRKVCGSPDGVCLVPAGQPVGALWEKELEVVGIDLRPDFVLQTALENNFSPNFEFIETYQMKDKMLQHIGLALLEEAMSETPVGRLYAESLSQTLIFHLLKNYSNANSTKENLIGGLSGYKLRRVTEFINENLEQDLTLGEIAEVADLSQFHFTRVFRQTTGLTPQQYVMQRRIEQAKQLLAVSDLPLVEVSLRTGFKNQSHFTTLFRKFTKLTPKMWRELKHA
jgi:AraC family transcriptional regulator